MPLPVPARPPLTPTEIRALPSETPVLVLWSGGNGPWRYILRHRSYDNQPPFDAEAWHEQIQVGTLLHFDHESRFGERMLDKVWTEES